jgi:hypothetical protein
VLAPTFESVSPSLILKRPIPKQRLRVPARTQWAFAVRDHPVIFIAVHSHIESIRGSDAAVPVSRVLDSAFLISEVCVDQSISLRVTLCPLEVVE